MMNSGFPRRALANETRYRGMSSGGWIDKTHDPWGTTVKAFLRKRKDVDGITVLPRAHLCCELDIRGIGRVSVGQVETIQNPIDGNFLYITDDTAIHGYIANVPFHHEHEKEANDIATDLAEICLLLEDAEFEEAKQRWSLIADGATEDAAPA